MLHLAIHPDVHYIGCMIIACFVLMARSLLRSTATPSHCCWLAGWLPSVVLQVMM